MPAGGICCLHWFALLEEFVGIADRHCEVGAAEALQDGKVHADYFAATVEERAAGASGSGGCVVVGRISCWEASWETMRVTLSVLSAILWATSDPARARMPSMPVG